MLAGEVIQRDFEMIYLQGYAPKDSSKTRDIDMKKLL